MNAPDLTTTFCGITLPNPLVLASGILGTSAALMARVAAGGAGAVTAKSCSRAPRPGHPNPTVLAWGAGFWAGVFFPPRAIRIPRAASKRGTG